MAIKISDMVDITTASLTDLHEVSKVVSPGVFETYKETNQEMVTLFNANIQLGSTAQVTGLDTALASKLNLSGGTMTGDLILNANPTNVLGAVTKQYADALVVGLLDDRGNYDASSNLWPSTGGSGTAGAILKGDLWYISVQGTLGGNLVVVGSSIRALTDTPGQTTANWDVLSAGLGYIPENIANKSTSTVLGTSDTLYPSQNAVKTYADTKEPTSNKNLANGFPGLNSNHNIQFKNNLGTHISLLANTNTAPRTYTFPNVDGEVLLTTGTQTITGAKTFGEDATFNALLNADGGISTLSGNIDIDSASGLVNILSTLQVDNLTSFSEATDLNINAKSGNVVCLSNFFVQRVQSRLTNGNLVLAGGATSGNVECEDPFLVTQIQPRTGTTVSITNNLLLPSQPSVSAYPSVALSNVTGDGTTYTIALNTELWDKASNFASNTFTAPVTGTYEVSGMVGVSGLTAAHVSGILRIVTSNRTWEIDARNYGLIRDTGNNIIANIGGVKIDMDAGDTATINLQVSGGTRVAGILPSSTTQTTAIQYKLVA